MLLYNSSNLSCPLPFLLVLLSYRRDHLYGEDSREDERRGDEDAPGHRFADKDHADGAAEDA